MYDTFSAASDAGLGIAWTKKKKSNTDDAKMKVLVWTR